MTTPCQFPAAMKPFRGVGKLIFRQLTFTITDTCKEFFYRLAVESLSSLPPASLSVIAAASLSCWVL